MNDKENTNILAEGNAAPESKGAESFLSIDKLLNGKGLYVFFAIAVVLVLIIFRNFFFFGNLYLYKDIGSDTVTYWWPHWVMISEYIRNLGIPKWSFEQGVGQNIYAFGIGDPFSLILCLMGKDTIPHAIIFMEAVKIIGGGFFFYLYLKALNLSAFTCLVGGLLYSFSGYMILGSGWYLVSTEALYASIVLYSGERFLRQGTWYLLPISFCLLAALQPFYVYLYALFLTVYCIVRFILGGGWRWKDILLTLVKMGALALFGVLLGSVVFLSNIFQLIQNPRVAGDSSLFHTLSSSSVFTLSHYKTMIAGIYRLFSNDLMGAGSNYRGDRNYLEAPILYVGLISLLLAPQAFLSFDKRTRRILFVLTVLCLIPMVFSYPRYMFWLFSCDYYRTYTFFLSLLLLFFALKALVSIERTSMVNAKALLISLLALLFLLFCNFYGTAANLVDKDLRNIVVIFLVLYTGLIYLLGTKKYKVYASVGLLVCVCTELAYFSSITVNDRIVVSNSDLSQKKGYNDYSVEAVKYVKAKDADFFRISKNYYSDASLFLSINDPQIQGFNGIADYEEWNQLNYVTFLREMHTTNVQDPDYSKWILGPSDRLLLLTFLNVKYFLCKQIKGGFASIGYDSLATFGDVTVAKNNYALPFGFSYNKCITLSEFRKFTNNIEKDEVLLNAFVIDDGDAPSFTDIKQVEAKDDLKVVNFVAYRACTNALRHDSLNVAFFDQNNIKGTFSAEAKKLLFFSIPYDKGWHALVDGKEADLYKVNIGFTGLLLGPGKHQIELHYIVPFFTMGLWMSVIALSLFVFAFIKYRKRAF